MSGSSTRPLIGLTTYLQRAQTGVWDVDASFLPKVYLDAVTRAGGVAVLLPPQPLSEGMADAVVGNLDGLIITGGRDVDPARYGQEAGPHTDAPSAIRDAWEDALLGAAIENDVPFLAICRGLQVLNVHRGGSLIQHLPDVVGDDRFNAGGGEFTVNEVEIDPGSRIAGLLDGDERLDVKSYHHQAVDALGAGLTVTARSGDGIVQAVELDDVSFGVGVQWHPEEDAADDARLFAGLVRAAEGRSAARAHRAEAAHA